MTTRFALTLFCFFVGLMFVLVPFVSHTHALTNPPVGTTWTDEIQTNPGQDGELNVTWTVRLESLSADKVSLRYTFTGEFGFITAMPCANLPQIPVPWTRISVQANFSGGKGSAPAPFVDDSLVASKPDYTSPIHVRCYDNMANPPPFFPNAITYVKYRNYRFSAIQSDIPLTFFSSTSVVQLRAVSNASNNAALLESGSVSLPTLEFSAATTTTKPKTSTTSSSVLVGEGTTTTEVIEESTTTLASDTTDVVRNADFDSVTTTELDAVAPDVEYNLAKETPRQEEERKEDTASSIAVTAAVLVSSLAAALPSLGAVGAVGALGATGGILGAVSPRSLSGGQLLPQVPSRLQDTYPDISGRNAPNSSNDSRSAREREIDLKNHFETPSLNSKSDLDDIGVEKVSAGNVFTGLVSVLQHVSRIRFLRPGLRRWAELALISPTIAVVAPICVVIGGLVSAVLRSHNVVSPVMSLLALFLLSVAAPVFALLASVGWALGRIVQDRQSFAIAVSELIALLPGLLFIPMMLRGLIGPRGRSKTWELITATICAPIVSVFAYRSWSLHIADVVGSFHARIFKPLGFPYGQRLLGIQDSATALYLSLAMSCVVMFIAVCAIRFADDHGHPIVMFRTWITLSKPQQRLRREYLDVATVELRDSSVWWQISRIAIAGGITTYALSEFLGWTSLVLTIFFTSGFLLVRRSSRAVRTRPIHPIMKTIPLVAVGLLLGKFSVSSDRAVIAFLVIAVVAIGSTTIRSRSLWD